MTDASLHWISEGEAPAFTESAILNRVRRIRESAHIVRAVDGRIGIAMGGFLATRNEAVDRDPLAWMATLPPVYPEWLGDSNFSTVHGVRFPYIAGEMANGIATTQLVIAMARAGMMSFFGAAGLPIERVEEALAELTAVLGSQQLPFGMNLIHTPREPQREDRLIDLYLRYGVSRISASAFMGITKGIVRYACQGLQRDGSGRIIRHRHVFAKISHPEVAKRFMSPAPPDLLADLIADGLLTQQEAELAQDVAIAEDITVEADSGGHTDKRPLAALFPVIAALRDELTAKHRYARPVRVGAAGGIGTPAAVASAFALGAAYVLTGSINQAAIESGQSDAAKAMLASADFSDVAMAPSSDMFELGVQVQVLKRGTMYSSKSQQLYDIYRRYSSLLEIPEPVRVKIEQEVFRAPLDQIWQETVQHFERRDKLQLERAKRDPKVQMALIFRWYLGKSSRWATRSVEDRKLDYQIWCGPAMGAFNAWASNSFLSELKNRSVVQIALNLLEGAAVLTRAHQLRTFGVPLPPAAFDYRPQRFAIGGQA